MKDVDLENEVSAIKTLCGTRDKPRTVLMELGINQEYFEDPRTKEMYRCVMALSKKNSQIPTYPILSQYPSLSPAARELIKDTDEKLPPARNVGDAEVIFGELDKIRKARIISKSIKKMLQILDPEDANPDDAVRVYEKTLLALRHVSDDTIIRVGLDSNLMEHVDRSLSRTKPNTIPTGFRDFDEDAGGLPRGGLTVFAASSGGGKSAMGLQVGINAVNAGYNVAIVTLEMNAEQITNRLMSNLAQTNHDYFHLAKAHAQQKKHAREVMDKWNEDNAAAGRRFQVYCIADTTMSSIALQLRVFDYDVIIIDYINLLNKDDTEGNNEAQALAEIARQAKVQASQTNAAWIVLAQLNEQGIVKYSRAIKEHADYMWTWTYGDAERESHVIDIEQQKSRNSKGFKFSLKERFEWQKFENIGSTYENRDLRGVRKAKKQKRHPTAKPMPGLGFDDEDDDDDE